METHLNNPVTSVSNVQFCYAVEFRIRGFACPKLRDMDCTVIKGATDDLKPRTVNAYSKPSWGEIVRDAECRENSTGSRLKKKNLFEYIQSWDGASRWPFNNPSDVSSLELLWRIKNKRRQFSSNVLRSTREKKHYELPSHYIKRRKFKPWVAILLYNDI